MPDHPRSGGIRPAGNLSPVRKNMQHSPMTVILILGAAVWADGPSPTLRRRTLHAASLYHAGRGSHIIPCGGIGRHPPAEALVMRDLLIGAGVPDDRILPEATSTNTQENIGHALPLLRQLGKSEVLIVTDHYHAPRARLTARRMGLNANSASPPLRGSHPGQQMRSFLREVPALLIYWWRVPRQPKPPQ